jgi:RIO kinase 1
LQDNAFEPFFDEGLITKIVRPIKSGKEASVHLCRSDPSTTGQRLVALKVYHPPDRREFRDEALYRDGEWIKPRRVRVAVEKRTNFGREVGAAIWVNREWESLHTLHEAGADVPRPIMRTERAILMAYVGDENDAAPQLRSYRPDHGESDELFRQVMRNVELMLYRNVIHGDLSAFNILVWEGQITLIDLPQAVDPRKNKHARGLLERDVVRVCEHFERSGVQTSPGRLADDLWTAWQFADLVPEELRGLI